MAPADDTTLSHWETCRARKYMPAAAAIARQLQGQQPWTPVDSDVNLAGELDVSPATVSRAKRLLATAGIVQKGQDNRYYTT
jgi:DNA-binding transcriptional regulator YhcF (GntR family)